MMSLRTCRLALVAVALMASATAWAQLTLVKRNRAEARIILTDDLPASRDAALLMQDFFKRITDANLTILTTAQLDRHPSKGDVLIGNGGWNKPFVNSKMTEDGFRIKTDDGFVRILSGGDKGAIYGVVTLLERYLGVKY